MKKIAKHSFTARLIYGKSLGFFIGLLLAFALSVYGKSFSDFFLFGIVLFYTILGVLIAETGVITKHPIFNFSLSFCLRGAMLGASMHLLLVLLSFDEIQTMVTLFDFNYFQSPFWVLIDGAIIGMFIDWITTKFGGEGLLPLK